MMSSPELVLMLLADARLPVAGHTQSASLEAAVRDGLTAAQVPAYLAARLRTVTRVEAGTAVVARHRLSHGQAPTPVERAWAARTPSAAMRRTSRGQARALLRLARHLWPEAAAIATVAAEHAPSRAVALGAIATACDVGPEALGRLVGYDDVQTVASAALKLLPLDPTTAAAWVHEAFPDIESLALDVRDLHSPEAIPAAGMPQLEVWAETHAVTTRRLFSA